MSGALDFTTGLRSRLSAIYSTLNTFGIHVPEHSLPLPIPSLCSFSHINTCNDETAIGEA